MTRWTRSGYLPTDWCLFPPQVDWCDWDNWYPGTDFCDFGDFTAWGDTMATVTSYVDAPATSTLWYRPKLKPEISSGFSVVLYGDSITRGATGVGIDNFSRFFPASWTQINRGVYGQFGVAGARVVLAAAPTIYSTDHADVVTMMWGANDCVLFPTEAANDLWLSSIWSPFLLVMDDTVNALIDNSIHVFIGLTPPMDGNLNPNFGFPIVTERQAMTRQYYRETYGNVPEVTIVDCWTDAPANITIDGVHLNTAGQIWVAAQFENAMTAYSVRPLDV